VSIKKRTNLEPTVGSGIFHKRFVKIKQYNRDESSKPDIFLDMLLLSQLLEEGTRQ
jgi:hypothetical protein